MDDIHITEPRYSEVPDERTVIQPEVQTPMKTSPNRSKPAEASSIQPKIQPTTKASPNRSEPPRTRSIQSQSPSKNSVRSETLDQEERKKSIFVNKIKAAVSILHGKIKYF